MPPKRKSASDLSDDQVYTKPPPPKRQAKLTAPKRRITYGKKTAPKLSRETLNREFDQTTVTQIWKGEFPEPEDDEEELNDEMFLKDPLEEQVQLPKDQSAEAGASILQEEEEEEEDGTGEYGTKSRGKKSKRKPAGDSPRPATQRKTIRKSTGNISKSETTRRKIRRKTEGDGSPENSGLQQQTMTQWHRGFTGTDSDSQSEQILEPELDEDIEEDPTRKKSIYDVPSSSQSLHLRNNVSRLSTHPEPPKITSPQRNGGPTSEMGPPQTPHKIQTEEIPSSQSPATPLSLPSRGSTRKRHPLKERTDNTPSPLLRHEGLHVSPNKLPKMEIEDTFDTDTHASQLSRIPTTPLKKSSPAKSVRFALQDEDSEIEASETPTKLKTTSVLSSQSLIRTARLEVFDSDAETDDEDTILPENGTPIEELQEILSSQVPIVEEKEDEELQEACHEEHEGPETYYEGFGEDTQFEAEKLVASSSNSELKHDDQEEDQIGDSVQEKTQMMESQRLSFHYRKAMAPITAQSDVFISLHPSKITEIINRMRDHEMRNWRLPPPVCRLWIYETAPVKAVKYMAEIGPLKLPGQITNERGLENAVFNTRRASSSWVAYEILQVYELSDTQSWVELKTKGWLNQPPTKFSKVPPAVAGELIYNLKSPLFISEDEAEPASSATDTQEAEAQLLSTIQQYTQPNIPLQHSSNQDIETEQEEHTSPMGDTSTILSTHEDFPVPSQATTVDLTQAQTPRRQSLAEVICESPSRPVLSSSVKMPTPRTAGSENHGYESLFPFTLPSSQLMTKSQMLPDSLLDESLAMPPPIIRDSDDEDDD